MEARIEELLAQAEKNQANGQESSGSREEDEAESSR